MRASGTIPKRTLLLLTAMLLSAGCGSRPSGNAEESNTSAVVLDPDQAVEPESTSIAETNKSEVLRAEPVQTAPHEPAENSASGESSSEEIDWGREVGLEAMIAMAKEGRIEEIQWHVMPNILRAKAKDGEIYHLRNENKGVDLRNTLLDAGVKIGKGGLRFQHVF
jgi:hypothetical protein